MESINTPLVEWTYSEEEWHRYIKIERLDMLIVNVIFGGELSIYVAIPFWIFSSFPIGIGFLLAVGVTYLLLVLSIPFRYGYLRKNIQNPSAKIYMDYFEINGKKVNLRNKIESLKSMRILIKKNNTEILVFRIRKVKPPYSIYEFHIPIPKGEREKALQLIDRMN